MCGLPRSGKSTVAKELEQGGYVRVCPDDIRRAIHGQQFYAPAEPMVWATAETMARALFIGGRNVVIDATNVTKARRLRWVMIAREVGADVDIVMIETPKDVCLARNNGYVDAAMIERMAAQYERPICREGQLLAPVPGVGFAVQSCECADCQLQADMQRVFDAQLQVSAHLLEPTAFGDGVNAEHADPRLRFRKNSK